MTKADLIAALESAIGSRGGNLLVDTFEGGLSYALAEIKKLLPDDGWKPIETAPKKGVGPFSPWMLLGHYEKKWVRIGHLLTASNRWYYSGTTERSQYSEGIDDTPTHWMHLPQPPQKLTDEQQSRNG